MSEEIEEELGLENWRERQGVLRPSREELNRIKRLSDENIEIIKRNKDTECEEEKRNIVVNLIAALDYYVREIVLWGIIIITQDKFSAGENYNDFKVSIKFLKKVIMKEKLEERDKNELRNEILEILKGNGYTYQKWNVILEKGLKIILPSKKIIEKINPLTAGKPGVKAKFQEANLEKLNKIRNNMVHHFDRNYTEQSERSVFDRDIKKDIKLIELIINSIHFILEEYEEEEANK